MDGDSVVLSELDLDGQHVVHMDTICNLQIRSRKEEMERR